MSNITLALICDVLQLFTAGFLGLLTGALLAEGALLVPYWRTLAPTDFYALHPTYAPLLFRFFAPLTIAAPSTALCAAVLAIAISDPGQWLSVAVAALALVIVSIYFIYFESANASFAKASVAHADLPQELSRWAAWHSRRTVISVIAFALSLLAMYW